jgi:hypothetical protein
MAAAIGDGHVTKEVHMKIHSIIGATSLGLVLALAPIGGATVGFVQTAFAKGGNGGGHGDGNGGGHGEGNSGHEKSGGDDTSSPSTNAAAAQGTSSSVLGHHADKDSKAHSASSKSHVSKPGAGSLSSLKRDYHAYLNSKDPKMALSAYVKAYAEFEIQYGTTAVPTDPALSDSALRSALAQLSNKPVTNQTLTEAKSILGVGTNIGKIAEVRDALERKSETATPSESTQLTDD